MRCYKRKRDNVLKDILESACDAAIFYNDSVNVTSKISQISYRTFLREQD